MAWLQDQTYSFTIARLLEGFLRIDSLTVNGINMILGGVDQGITPTIHPGDTVSVEMVASNQGELADNFQIKAYKDGALFSTSPSIPLAIGATYSYTPMVFTMPSANVGLEIRTFHEE